MSLDNIQLPSIVLQQLYKYSLTDLKNEQKREAKTPSNEFTILGNNRSRILIIVANDEALYLPDGELKFLLGILAACNLTMEDVAILNIKKNKPVTYQTVTQELKPEKLFLFGVDPAGIALPLDFPNYQIQQYNNQTYLTAPLLSHFQDNKAEKTKLWNCLKQIFGI
jgi:DNA polymerase III psi subunit